MEIARTLEALDPFAGRSVVTVGNFDGVHRGHQMVISNVLARAEELNARSVAVTFDPHPSHVLRDGPKLPLLTTTEQKLELLAATGLDTALVLPFTDDLRHWSARHFAEAVLRDRLNAVEVHEGENFRFGFGAELGIEGLTDLGHECAFAVRAYHPLLLRGEPVSSSRIRRLLTAGALPEARALLGRPHAIISTPAPGRGYGTRFAVPTINLAPSQAQLPAKGVYVTTLRIGAEPHTSRMFRGVTNVGDRPTFGAASFAVETHLFAFEPVDLDEKTPLELTFLHRLRDEQRFDDPAALRAQIGHDVRHAERFFALCARLS